MMEAADEQYHALRHALAGERLPAAFIDLDALELNIQSMAQRAGVLPIRLVTKSIRSVPMLRFLLGSTPVFQGLLCYNPAEAAWLAEQGFDDLVVAYPSVQLSEVSAVARQLQLGRRITLMVDDVAQVELIEAQARKAGVVMPLAIDLDMSSDFPGLRFGVYRSPINGEKAALRLASRIAAGAHVRLDGLMGYEGQIAGLMDDVPGQAARNRMVRWLKHRSVKSINQRREATVAALAAAGHTLRFINGGGTGSFETTRLDRSVTELAAGSGLYLPTLFDHYAAFHAVPAAGFALPVARIPRPGMVTCSGGGYPASGPAGSSRLPQPWLPAYCRLVANEGTGEVQTPVILPSKLALTIGDPVFFRHAKAGELCERFNELLLLKGGKIVERVSTYRGDGKCFL